MRPGQYHRRFSGGRATSGECSACLIRPHLLEVGASLTSQIVLANVRQNTIERTVCGARG